MAKRARRKTRHYKNVRDLGVLSDMFSAVAKAPSRVARTVKKIVRPSRRGSGRIKLRGLDLSPNTRAARRKRNRLLRGR